MKGKCKHGLKGRDCQYIHPKACTKLLKFGNKQPRGCNQGTACENFHPRMCSLSIKRGECFNNSCTFTHVKGTKRQQAPKKHNNLEEETQDFRKILDNFRTEIISLVNNCLQTPQFKNQHSSHQPIPQHILNHRQNLTQHPPQSSMSNHLQPPVNTQTQNHQPPFRNQPIPPRMLNHHQNVLQHLPQSTVEPSFPKLLHTPY